MEKKGLFKKYYSRLALEGAIKGFVIGLIAGFAASLIFATTAFFSNGFATVSNYDSATRNVILISIAIWIVVTLATTPVFYLLFFTPKIKQVVRRVDRLGMEERLVTMTELENDESYIAMRQREDAKSKLSRVNPKQLALAAFMLVPYIVVIAIGVFSITMTAVSATSVESPLGWQSAQERKTEEIDPEPDGIYKYYTVEYLVVGGGYIDGDAFQVVVEGQDAAPVVATPYPGYMFKDWIVSGSENARKQELGVTEDLFDVAQFEPAGDDGDEDGDSSEEPLPQPGDGEDDEFDPNLIIDGTIYYREEEIFEAYLAYAMAILAAGGEVPMDLRLFIELYFDSIK